MHGISYHVSSFLRGKDKALSVVGLSYLKQHRNNAIAARKIFLHLPCHIFPSSFLRGEDKAFSGAGLSYLRQDRNNAVIVRKN